MIRVCIAIACCISFGIHHADCQNSPSGSFKEAALSDLTDKNVSTLGTQALAIRPAEWKHGESTHFIYHFFQSFVAAQVAAEAEFYYGVTAKDLGKDTSQWERKCHIFIFDKPEDWSAFRVRGQLDPWTGGLHAQGELFILRNPQYKWKGHTLAHEVSHLIVHRFCGSGVPLWLNEGFAEYAGSRGYAWFYRNRGYQSPVKIAAVDPKVYIPIAELTAIQAYPSDPDKVGVFYDESHRLVAFLAKLDKTGFGTFLEAMSQGNRFDSALSKGFGSRYSSVDALEKEFKDYATKEFGTAIDDR